MVKAYLFTDSKNLQLFRLSKDVIVSSGTVKQVNDIYADMVEVGIADPPFYEFAVEISSSSMAEFFAKFISKTNHISAEHAKLWGLLDRLLFEYTLIKKSEAGRPPTFHAAGFAFFSDGTHVPIINELQTESEKILSEYILEWVSLFLIVLLATKNIEKTTKFHKDISKGRTSKATKYRERYAYTTTLTIGKITENYDGSEFTGVSRRPHLRRGHVRTQHYGPRNEMTKKVFIPSVFVNGSEDLKSNRVAYNVSFAA